MENRTKRREVFLALGTVCITITVVFFAEPSFSAALQGLRIWWDVIIPALLPFFILAELLMALGVVHSLGVFLEPFMRPLFRIPGVGAFALAMGLASGYPIGAKIAGDLRRQSLCSQSEGERLLCLANTADPLFIIGAVGVGMFGFPELAFILCACHYISILIVGITFRFHGFARKGTDTQEHTIAKRSLGQMFRTAYEKLLETRENDSRSLGQILAHSIEESLRTIFLIGGYIVIFSVITELIQQIHLHTILFYLLNPVLRHGDSLPTLFLPLLSGIMEITNGTALTSVSEAPLLYRIALTNALIAWSGLSVHAQTAAMVQGTDLSIRPYILARLFHGLLAGGLTFFWRDSLQHLGTSEVFGASLSSLPLWSTVYQGLLYALIAIICMFSMGLLIRFLICHKKL